MEVIRIWSFVLGKTQKFIIKMQRRLNTTYVRHEIKIVQGEGIQKRSRYK